MNLKNAFRTSVSVLASAALTLSASPVLNADMLSTASAITFIDVEKGAYYEEPVNWAVKNNITNGTSATRFSPDEDCTLEQILTFIWRAAGTPEPASDDNPFANIASSNFYIKPLTWAHEEALVSGNSFQLETPCTRSEAVTFLWRQAGRPTGDSKSFSDVPPGSECAKAVAWAVNKGITQGTGANTFSPDMVCTRGQIVTFLWRAAESYDAPPLSTVALKSGTWLALDGIGYRYFQFSADSTTGAIVSPSDNENKLFSYTLNDSNAVFQAEGESNKTASITHNGENTMTLNWEDGSTETLSYISKNIGDKFSFYTDVELCRLAMDYYEAHGDEVDPEKGESVEAAEAATNPEDGSVLVSLYGAHGGYEEPLITYTVNRITGKGTGRNGTKIDLNEI